MIPYVREMDFTYGEPQQVSPLIRRIVARNPGPFTYLGTGTYIIGAGDVAVIDPGPLLEEHLEALVAALAGERVVAILTTHTHLDHSPLAHPLKARLGGLIYGRSDPMRPTAFEEGNQDGFAPDVEVADGASVRGPDWTLTALATPGHASNHVCYALVEENALFSGDHVMGWSTTVISPPDGDMSAYYKSLAAVRGRRFKTLWPTHGPPITDVDPFLEAYEAHRRDRETQILAAIDAGRADIPSMVEVIYAAVDKRLHPAAAHSVYAHLIHLARMGLVSVEDGVATPSSRFRRTI
jgi:glyoxylase-like metal-dependent hydrolase (beta-lactamase superfamily II)